MIAISEIGVILAMKTIPIILPRWSSLTERGTLSVKLWEFFFTANKVIFLVNAFLLREKLCSIRAQSMGANLWRAITCTDTEMQEWGGMKPWIKVTLRWNPGSRLKACPQRGKSVVCGHKGKKFCYCSPQLFRSSEFWKKLNPHKLFCTTRLTIVVLPICKGVLVSEFPATAGNNFDFWDLFLTMTFVFLLSYEQEATFSVATQVALMIQLRINFYSFFTAAPRNLKTRRKVLCIAFTCLGA